jgi:hypothetical protein
MDFILPGNQKGKTVTLGGGAFTFVDGVCPVPNDPAMIAAARNILVRYHGAKAQEDGAPAPEPLLHVEAAPELVPDLDHVADAVDPVDAAGAALVDTGKGRKPGKMPKLPK